MAIPSEYEWFKKINDLWIYDWSTADINVDFFTFGNYGWYRSASSTYYPYTPIKPLREMSILSKANQMTNYHNQTVTGSTRYFDASFSTTVVRIKITSASSGVDVAYENINLVTLGNAFNGVYSGEQNYKGARLVTRSDLSVPKYIALGGYTASGGDGYYKNLATHYESLDDALNGIFGSFANVEVYVDDDLWVNPPITITSNGGGATHIAKRTGQLKDLSSYTSDILIVSGGGGGGLLVDTTEYTGKEAGGISGSGDNSADQSAGNAFGQGESGTDVSGGGSGLYGGYKGTSSKSGGAGSGYIGNSLLSNKKMVGYNVPTSSAEGTKTESVSVFDSNYVADKPKAGNGHVRIKFLWDEGDDDMHSYSESEHRVGTWTNGKPVYEKIVNVSEFAGTNNTWINTGVNIPNGEEIIFVGFAQAHALSDGFLFNCFGKFNDSKDVLAYFATGTYTYYYSRCFIQYTKTTD